MISIYKITIKRQLSFLSFSIIFILIIGTICYYAAGFGSPTIWSIVFTFCFCLPGLIIHIQYLSENWNSILTIDRSMKSIIYKKKSFILKYSFDSIQDIIKTKSYQNSIRTYAQDEYFYYKIIFKDGAELIITCLLADDLESIFTLIYPNKIKIIKKVLPFVA